MRKPVDRHGAGTLCEQEGVLDPFRGLHCGSVAGAWYAVRYNPGDANLALPALHRLGYATFHPQLRVLVPDRRLGQRSVRQAAFPGYCFAWWLDGSDWTRILRQPGIAGVLHRVGDRAAPIPVPQGEVERMMARAHEGGIIEDMASLPAAAPLSPGDPVRITAGALAGHGGLCLLDGPARVRVLLTLMGAERRVDVARSQVEPA